MPWDIGRWASGPSQLPDDAEALGAPADLYRLHVQVGTARPEQLGSADRLVPVEARGRESSWEDAAAVRVLPSSRWPGGRRCGPRPSGWRPGRRRAGIGSTACWTIWAGSSETLQLAIPAGTLEAAVHLARFGIKADAAALVSKVMPVGVMDLTALVGGTAQPIDTDALRSTRVRPHLCGSACRTARRRRRGCSRRVRTSGESGRVRPVRRWSSC
ncbi:hypothetical protein D0Q02_16190 [Micromonospora craniellae]|uniref:Uncharacterized protein n=1 Tax=Micromonospora craniellae TaxID=2294034 RepID=A0A372FXV1_9ACTN|nr:hypothetical protein D0Q02_16190 [Micromonospora craniellae]